MRNHTQLSRADLLICLQAGPEGTQQSLAAALGYVDREPARSEKSSSSTKRSGTGSEPKIPQIVKPKPQPVRPKAHFYRVIAQRRLEPAEVVRDEPDWFRRAEPYREEIRANPDIKPPAQLPLMRWSRLWPCLKMILGARLITSALDIPRIVDQLARGQMLRELPHQLHKGWAARCHILVDGADPLQPFRDDVNGLLHRLRQLRGPLGLSLVAFPDGDPMGRCLFYMQREWREGGRYRIPVAGTPVLVLSDLGCIDETDIRRRQWMRLGTRLRQAGCRPVALMPCPSRWWDRELTRLFYPICWDRTARVPRRLMARPHRSSAARQKACDRGPDRLLNLLAPAIRVEPALLRAVRYLLPAQVADVGSEAAAWNHPHVRTTPLAFYYDAESIEAYREAFKKMDDALLKRQVAALIIAHHVPLSPAIGYEEQLILSESGALVGSKAAESFIEGVVKTMHTPYGLLADAARDWVLRWERRQHRTMWQKDALAAAWATAHLSQLRAGEPVDTPEGLALSRVSWLLAASPQVKSYRLLQRGQRLYLEPEGSIPSDAVLDVPGSPLADVLVTAPYIQVRQIVADHAEREPKTVPLDQAISVPLGGRLHLQTDYEELSLDSIYRPDWAEAIGRDEQGLFVSWANEQRRAYWINPGAYPLYGRTGEHLGELMVDEGYWCDEAQALAQWREGFRQPAWAETYGVDVYGLYAGFSIDGVAQLMRWIPPGEFCMGSPESEPEREDNEIPHSVVLIRGFWLADTACPQALWQAVMGDNPSRFRGESRPVEQVSWEDAQRFIEHLNTRIPDADFRLPSESEWEYACRAGRMTAFWFGDQITPEQANYDGNRPYADGTPALYRRETVDVNALPCNGWGLYQMHGNVWEWCQDWYGPYPSVPVVDPVGPERDEFRVLRGGGWFYDGRNARSAQRLAIPPGDRGDDVGFRLALGRALE